MADNRTPVIVANVAIKQTQNIQTIQPYLFQHFKTLLSDYKLTCIVKEHCAD